MTDHIKNRASFDLIRYANCWEDPELLREALRPVAGKRILSIASGGDNSFALLADGAEVVAADISTAQLACVELKREAIRRLDYHDVLAFLGISPATDRLSIYVKLKGNLPDYASSFWSRHEDLLIRGIIHAGKFEHFFNVFRKWVLPLIHGRKTIEELLVEKSSSERSSFYHSIWDNRRWQLLFRVFFSRFVMGRLGRDPEFFYFVEGSVAERILERAKYALTVLPTHDNPYLEYILRGNFSDGSLPGYLLPDHFAAVRDGLDRLEIFHGSVEEAAAHYGPESFDGFNLSDIFEYLSPDICQAMYGALLGSSRSGARLAYWNMLVPRRCPEEFGGKVHQLTELAQDLFNKDRAFFYSAFRVEEVLP